MYNQLDPALYFKSPYDFKERFISYWHQINEITKLKPSSTLEIGIGNGFVSDYLKQRDFNITTMDIEQDLSPTIVGSITHAPFIDGSFELVACFEILEHLPYDLFPTLIREINRLTRKYAILSLPDASPAFSAYFDLLRFGKLKVLFPLPQIRASRHVYNGEHYWEIGKQGYKLQRILRDIALEKFAVARTYRVFEIPYHRFFILRKSTQNFACPSFNSLKNGKVFL